MIWHLGKLRISTVVVLFTMCVFVLSCARNNVLRQTIIHCSLPEKTMMMHMKDTLTKYGFAPFNEKGNMIQTIRRIDEGISIRNVYIDALADSTIGGVSLTVKTVVYFRQSIDTVFYDETVKTVPDNRGDFIPLFNALRMLCNQETASPNYIKKRQVVPWKR